VDVHRSARKHGIVDEDVHHACDHVLVVDQLDAESDSPKLLVVGPDRAGRLLEVVVLVLADERLMAIPAMPLRARSTTCCHRRRITMTENPKTYRTARGREMTDDDIDHLSDEVAATEYDVGLIKQRRRGRPSIGDGPAQIVPVRLDPQLGAALDERVEREQSNRSEVIRRALREYLAR
jgi:hypothetical protein